MWKQKSTGGFPEERPPVGAPPRPQPPTVAPAAKVPARIGSTLYFRGDLQGEEDLVIEGRIEGKISMKQGNVSVGERGRVEADIEAASIQVAGLRERQPDRSGSRGAPRERTRRRQHHGEECQSRERLPLQGQYRHAVGFRRTNEREVDDARGDRRRLRARKERTAPSCRRRPYLLEWESDLVLFPSPARKKPRA